MERKIITWTQFCERAKFVHRHRPEDYANLMHNGTDRFLTGYHVACDGGSFRVSTLMKNGGAGTLLCRVVGIRTDGGKVYTKLEPHLIPTNYRKRFWDKHMPVSFPNGLPKRGEAAMCRYHSGDDVHQGEVRFRKNRSETAIFSVHGGNHQAIMLNDETLRIVNLAEGRAAKPAELENFEHSVEDRYPYRVTCNFPAWSCETVEITAKFVPGQCETRDEWLRSIVHACNQGLADREIVLPLAARMWNAAYLFCQEHKNKRAYFYPMPMRLVDRTKDKFDLFDAEPTPILRLHNTRELAGGEKIARLSADAERWHLASIVIRFNGNRKHSDSTSPTYYDPPILEARRITMTLPPFGNPLLEERPEYAAPNGRTYECYQAMFRDATHDSGPHRRFTEDTDIVRYTERAYHRLVIIDPDKINGRDAWLLRDGRRRFWTKNTTWAEQRDGFLKWSENPGCIHVTSDFDELCADKPTNGTFCTATGGDVGIPMTPEGAVSVMQEQWLLDSLPLS